ncbi:VapE domain-containing protein [Alteripontixanthobacter maritimus]|nr:VapE domain-containing protein [Alteripontixanthobacter maritimus]
MNREEYAAKLGAQLNYYTDRAAKGLDCVDVLKDIEWGQELAAETDYYLSRLTQSKVITRNAIEKARRAAAKHREQAEALASIIETIDGEDPTTPYGFVYGRLRKLAAQVSFKGEIVINGNTHVLPNVQRQLRIASREAGFSPSERSGIDDCATEWFESSRSERVKEAAEQFAVRQKFDFNHFARTYFSETTKCDHKMVAAILKKFVHQVRRKLAGQDVTNHLMLVLHGPQGCGKTYLLEKLLAPLAEFSAWSDFEQISDGRNLDLWKHRVIVLDEMAKSKRADIETIKHVITAASLDRRPMRSNHTVQIKNRAVLIGASNHRLDEIIRDETGNRRFAELLFRPDVEHAAIKHFKFNKMWAAVQPGDVDPIAQLMPELQEYQSMSAVAGPVLDWLQNRRHALAGGTYSTQRLFEQFRDYRESAVQGLDYQSRTASTFSAELRRITEHESSWGIEKVRHGVGVRWNVSDLWRKAA